MTSAPRLSRVSAAIAIAFALAAAPASAAGYLKLGDIKGESAARSGHGGQIDVESWSWGAAATRGADGKWFVADSFSFGVEREMKESGEKGGTEDINIGVGELQEATISKSMDAAASGTPAGKRMHKPMTITKELDKSTPLLRQGSMTTLVPAGTCRLGARYPTAELGTGNRVYRMTNVVVTSCSASGSGGGGDARPMESISLNYEKVVWN